MRVSGRQRACGLFALNTVLIWLIAAAPPADARVISTPVSRFAVIGDYGDFNNPNTLAVANLVHDWSPDFIVTVGDNNYCFTTNSYTYDDCVGRYYHDYIAPYTGTYGSGAMVNRFWPTMGNHDWDAQTISYTTFFSLPNNERTYDLMRGPLHFFMIDSDDREPAGNTAGSLQAQWIGQAMTASTATWKIPVFHHPSYSTGVHGDSAWMQAWPFKFWGASVVLSGHDHDYERLVNDHLQYLVVGTGGESIRAGVTTSTAVSLVRVNEFGAVLGEADACRLRLRFFTASGEQRDTLLLIQPGCPRSVMLPMIYR